MKGKFMLVAFILLLVSQSFLGLITAEAVEEGQTLSKAGLPIVDPSGSESNAGDASDNDPDAEPEQEMKPDKEPKEVESAPAEQDVADGGTVEDDEIPATDHQNVIESADATADEKADDEQNLTDDSTQTIQPVANIDINLITKVTLKDSDGQVIDAEENPENRPGIDDAVTIEFEWALPNGHGYRAGDTFTFQIPEAFKLYNELEGVLDRFGTYHVEENGTVTFTFNERIEQESNIRGTLEVNTIFNKETITGSTKQKIEFPFEDGPHVITVHFKANIDREIDKSGIPNKAMNPDKVHWTVDFNKSEKTISNAVLNDPIQAGQTLDYDSIKVYDLIVNLDGSVSQGELVDSSAYEIKQTDDGFQVVFKDTIHQAYRVQFDTSIEDQTTPLNNRATLSGDGTDDLNASARVHLNYGEHLKKEPTGYDPTEQKISWKVQYNFNEVSIPRDKANIHDVFDTGFKLVDGSLKVYPITFNDSGQPVQGDEITGNAYTVEVGDHEFKVQFNNDIDSAYEIVYETISKEPVYDNREIKNTVSSGEKSVEGKQPIRQVILQKSNKGANYADKVTHWEIKLNGNNFKMENVVVKDSYKDTGLTLLPDTVEITGPNGLLTPGTDYRLSPDPSYDEGFKIEFLKEITAEHTIKYSTEFDPAKAKNNNYKNRAFVEWDENGERKDRKEDSATFNPDEYTKANGYKYGQYNAVTKEITWTVGVNYNLYEIDHPIVRDFFGENQKIVEGSLKVENLKLTGGRNGVEVGEELSSDQYEVDYTVTDDEGNAGFELTFNGPIDSAYQITYKTTVDGQLIEKEYTNTATLFNNEELLADLDASVSVKHGGEYVNKNGQQSGKAINWQIYINRGQSVVEEAKIFDHLQNNQILVENSFRLYTTTVNEAGEISKGELAGEDVYDLVITTDDEGNQTFELAFNDTIAEPYILEYQSFINAGNGAKISNSVKMEGIGIEELEVETSEEVIVRSSAGGGSGEGVQGSLTVTKVDAADTDTTLAGAVFTLYDSSGEIAIRTLTTDENGKVEFRNLLLDDYILKEISAPDGYLVGIHEEGREVKIDQETNEITITNQKIVRAFELTKVDADDETIRLQGAVFELWFKADGTDEYTLVPGKLTTDEAGKISVEDLLPGDYKLIEGTPPEHYVLDQTPIEFTIGEEQTAAHLFSKENSLQTGAVQLIKRDKDVNEMVLAGAEFKLTDQDGQTIAEGLTTNDEGSLLIEDLKPGQYQLIETKAPFGYELDETPLEFEIVKSQQETLTVTKDNQIQLGAVQLEKLDKDNPDEKLEGAEFNLLDDEGEIVREGLTTNEDGIVRVNNLRPGDYSLVETKAPLGYKLSEEPINFTIEYEQETPVQLVFENELILRSVELIKVDANDHDLTLEGAQFTLLDEDDQVVAENLTTDANGKIVVDGLKPGKYTFVETDAPMHYVPSTEPIHFELVKGDTHTVTLTVENELIRGGVQLTKVDQDDEQLFLEGAEFTLEDAAGNTIATNLTTNEDGQFVVNDLLPGDYQFIETKAPEGYRLDPTPIPFTVDKSQQEIVQVTKSNEFITGTVELTKIDADDPTVTLEGAEFKLLDVEHNVLQSGLTTNKDGKLIVENLLPGEYTFVETKAPAGYVLDSTPQGFTIELGQAETVHVVVENTAEPQEETPVTEKPNTPDQPGQPSEPGNGSTDQDDAKKLPKTATAIFSYVLAGLFAILIGLFLLRRVKSNQA